MSIVLPIQNIRILDFTHIITSSVETNLLNDLHEYNLIKDDKLNIKNKEVKRLCYHHIIHGLCEYVLKVKSKQRIIIHYCEIIPPTKHLQQYVNTYELQQFFNSLIIKIIKMLPIKFLILDDSFNSIKREIKHDQGRAADVSRKAESIVDSFDISKYTFTKARYFAKRYGLNYLSTNYFNKIKSRQLIMM